MSERTGFGALRRRIGREPNLTPPVEVLLRHRARVLDPVTAVRATGRSLQPTVYITNALLVRGYDGLAELLDTAAAGHGVRAVPNKADLALAAQLPDQPVSVRVILDPADGATVPAEAPDAWRVLQSVRAATDEATGRRVELDHLMTACAPVEGVPFVGGYGVGGVPFVGGYGVGGVPFVGGYGVGAASDQYAIPGLGGRTPVTWMGGPPTRTPGLTGRRPVVAVLDTAIGQHEWFTDDVVERDPTVDGDVIGLGGGDGSGISADPFEGVLDTDTGHGTFIAGLVHQLCPDARLLGIRIMSTSGAVREGDLLNVLWQLVRRQELAQRTGDPDLAVDIVNLSLGYYHETPKDAGYDSSLLSVLLALSRLGVAVVAAAGNGSTDRLMYPAAFAPFDEGAVAVRRDRVPLVSVGAQNPDRTVALYSNTGPWVTCYRPGANLVSTMPTLTNGGAQATFEVTLPGYPPRATLDPDSFASGFALWSGTSFAAPVLAGELAAAMVGAAMTGVGDDDRALDDVSVTACVDRAWAAISARTGIERPA